MSFGLCQSIQSLRYRLLNRSKVNIVRNSETLYISNESSILAFHLELFFIP